MHFTTLTTAVLGLASLGVASPIAECGQAPPETPAPQSGWTDGSVKQPSPGAPPPSGPPKAPGPPGQPGHQGPPNGPPKPPGGYPHGPGPTITGLNAAIRSRGKEWFGTAITPRNDTVERAIINDITEIGSLTPENAMKWETTEPDRGNFTFDGADEVVAIATANGDELHCHNLVWHSQLSPWVTEGNYDNATLIQIMKDHITAVAGRYKDVCTRWDVVNEALNENGTYRESVWYQTIGEAYLPLAFKFAAAVTPKSKLYYNDYNLEDGGNKTQGAKRIVELVQSYGVRIDGVGFQAHLTSEGTESSGGGVAPDRATLVDTLSSVAALGVDVAYTELDIRLNVPANASAVQAQAEVWDSTVRACMDVEACRGITVWGISDKYSWIPGTFPGEGEALLWDEDLMKKLAYNVTLEAILSYPAVGKP